MNQNILDPILDDLRVGLRRRNERRRRVRAASAASAAAVVLAVSAVSAIEQSSTTPGASPITTPATFTPVSSGECFTSLAACGLSNRRT
jgi:hypothetical protein